MSPASYQTIAHEVPPFSQGRFLRLSDSGSDPMATASPRSPSTMILAGALRAKNAAAECGPFLVKKTVPLQGGRCPIQKGCLHMAGSFSQRFVLIWALLQFLLLAAQAFSSGKS